MVPMFGHRFRIVCKNSGKINVSILKSIFCWQSSSRDPEANVISYFIKTMFGFVIKKIALLPRLFYAGYGFWNHELKTSLISPTILL